MGECRIYKVILYSYAALLAFGGMGCSDSAPTAKTPETTLIPDSSDTSTIPDEPTDDDSTNPLGNPFWDFTLEPEDTTDTTDEATEGDGITTFTEETTDDTSAEQTTEGTTGTPCDDFWIFCKEGQNCQGGQCVTDAGTTPTQTDTETTSQETTEATGSANVTPSTFTAAPAALGGDCTHDVTHCNEEHVCQPCATGLVCNAASQCAPPTDGDAGAACDPSNASACGAGLTCGESLTATGATEYRCARYVSPGRGGFCNPEAGLLCAAGKNLVCVEEPNGAQLAQKNRAAFGRCERRARLGEGCRHALIPCTDGKTGRDCPTSLYTLPCFDGLVCTSEFTGGEGTCIAVCPNKQYAQAPLGHQTVPLVVELYEKANFQGHRAVVATTDGIYRDWEEFKTSWLGNCDQPFFQGTNYVWCRDTVYELSPTSNSDDPDGDTPCALPIKEWNKSLKKSERWCRRDQAIPAILPEKIDKKARSIRVYAGPNYVAGDKMRLHDNVFGYGDSVVPGTDPLLSHTNTPLLEMGPGECADLHKPETCSFTYLRPEATLKDKVRSVTIGRGVYVTDYCATPTSASPTWETPIYAIVTVRSGKLDSVTGEYDPRRTQIIADTSDLHTYMMTSGDGKKMAFMMLPGPDLGIGQATVMLYQYSGWTVGGQDSVHMIGTSSQWWYYGPNRSLQILPPAGSMLFRTATTPDGWRDRRRRNAEQQ